MDRSVEGNNYPFVMRNAFIVLTLLGLTACKYTDSFVSKVAGGDTFPVRYAKGFCIIRYPSYDHLQVYNPWQGARGVVLNYLLSRHPENINNPAYPVIKVPVTRVVCFSTTHIAMIDALGKSGSIVGVSGSHLVCNQTVQHNIRQGKAVDVGYPGNMNYELLMSIKPDVIFVYGVGNEAVPFVKKLSELGFVVVFNAEFLENTPLGKAEWILFMSMFYDACEQARQIFDTVAVEYLRLKQCVAGITQRPRVLYGLPWNGIWYMAGGQSYAARLIEDAGGDYLWKDLETHEALPLTIEAVIARAAGADVWINAGAAGSRKDILAVEKRLASLKVFQQGNIYNNNARVLPGGGNDYWESGVMKPQLILKDLIHIFHPEKDSASSFYYYRKLE